MYDIKDERGVPVSSGIPPIVTWSVLIGVGVVFLVIALAIGTSNYHHVWPYMDTTKIKLG